MFGSKRTAVLAFTIVLGVGALSPVTAGPASASVPGLGRFEAVSVRDSTPARSVTATCPAGRRLVGTGAQITGGGGQVGIEVMRPNGDEFTAPTSNTVVAREIDEYLGNWSVTAYAICANPLPGLSRHVARTDRDSAENKDVTATCQDNKQLVGTGAEITEGGGKVVFDDLRPNGGTLTAPTAFTATADEADDFPGDWSVTAYAICANPLPGLTRYSATSVSDPTDHKSVSQMCPAGKKLTGLGGEITGALGEAVFDSLFPNGTPLTAPTTSNVGVSEEDPFDSNWRVTAYAICANT